MLSGVGIICFAGSYAVALALEVSRLLFRSGVRGAVMLGFAGAGLVAHSAFLYYEAVEALSRGAPPLSGKQHWYMLAAWVLVVCYLYLVYYHPRAAFGLFLLPLVLGLIATGRFFAETDSIARADAWRVWGIIHGTSILLAAVSVLMGFAAGLMYLGQARRLKHKRPPVRGLRLPSLEWLQRTNGRAIVVSVLMLGVGVLSGIILSRMRSAELSWGDPIVFSTTAMFGWLLVAVIVGALYRPAREGRKVAYLTVVSFVFLVIALGVFLGGQHGGGEEGGRGKAEGGRAWRGTEHPGAPDPSSLTLDPWPLILGPWPVTSGLCWPARAADGAERRASPPAKRSHDSRLRQALAQLAQNSRRKTPIPRRWPLTPGTSPPGGPA